MGYVRGIIKTGRVHENHHQTDANDNVPNLHGQKHIRGLKHNNKKIQIRFNGWGSGR